jgi:hypothetical protein
MEKSLDEKEGGRKWGRKKEMPSTALGETPFETYRAVLD